LKLKIADAVSVGFEHNGLGYIGFIVELPGAYIRGRTLAEALGKADSEIGSYLRWLNLERPHHIIRVNVVQEHKSSLIVEDADNEILLDGDKDKMASDEFELFSELALKSGKTFNSVYESSALKDWTDASKKRKTFYGMCPRTIREVLEHVKSSQYYYLSRAGLARERKVADFLATREACLRSVRGLFEQTGNHAVYEVDNELWTVKKILRRLVWHDRIHAKGMARMQAKQKAQGLIKTYEDPFCFVV
jgi:hypothetical protein